MKLQGAIQPDIIEPPVPEIFLHQSPIVNDEGGECFALLTGIGEDGKLAVGFQDGKFHGS